MLNTPEIITVYPAQREGVLKFKKLGIDPCGLLLAERIPEHY